VTADRAVEKVRLRRVNRTLIGQSATAEGLDSLGSSALMREVARQVTLLAHSDRSAVLLLGEPGTGKRWVSRLLHDVSPRGSAPFIEVACGAGDAAWLEAELFGREGGSGGENSGDRRQGLVEVADGGSLFLDEITDLPLELQAKLVALLETRAFRRIGGTREIPVDVRVIAASARPLAPVVEAGRFRQDFCYMLDVMPVTMPPLRERSRDDFLGLIRRFLKELGPANPPLGRGPRPLAEARVAGQLERTAQRARTRAPAGARQRDRWCGAPAGGIPWSARAAARSPAHTTHT